MVLEILHLVYSTTAAVTGSRVTARMVQGKTLTTKTLTTKEAVANLRSMVMDIPHLASCTTAIGTGLGQSYISFETPPPLRGHLDKGYDQSDVWFEVVIIGDLQQMLAAIGSRRIVRRVLEIRYCHVLDQHDRDGLRTIVRMVKRNDHTPSDTPRSSIPTEG